MDMQWMIVTVAVFLAGAGLGFLLGFVLRRGDNAKLADAEAELDAYKRDVSEHFGQSAQHFQAIGSHYRQLYEHMAAGSEKLCNPIESDDRLKFPPPAEVAIASSATVAPPTTEDAEQTPPASDVESETAEPPSAEQIEPAESTDKPKDTP